MSTPAREVWSSLSAPTQQEVGAEIQRILQEMIDEHFRFDPVQPLAAPSPDLRPPVDTITGKGTASRRIAGFLWTGIPAIRENAGREPVRPLAKDRRRSL